MTKTPKVETLVSRLRSTAALAHSTYTETHQQRYYTLSLQLFDMADRMVKLAEQDAAEDTPF